MDFDTTTSPEHLVFHAISIGSAALKHLTNVLESHVSHEYAFKLSVEDATNLASRISNNLADGDLLLMQSLLAENDQEVVLTAVKQFATCWLANLSALKSVIDTHSAWRDQVTRSEHAFGRLVEVVSSKLSLLESGIADRPALNK